MQASLFKNTPLNTSLEVLISDFQPSGNMQPSTWEKKLRTKCERIWQYGKHARGVVPRTSPRARGQRWVATKNMILPKCGHRSGRATKVTVETPTTFCEIGCPRKSKKRFLLPFLPRFLAPVFVLFSFYSHILFYQAIILLPSYCQFRRGRERDKYSNSCQKNENLKMRYILLCVYHACEERVRVSFNHIQILDRIPLIVWNMIWQFLGGIIKE